MPRISVNPGRDLSKSVVDMPEDAPHSVKALLLALRWYLVPIFVLGLLGLVVWTLLLLSL